MEPKYSHITLASVYKQQRLILNLLVSIKHNQTKKEKNKNNQSTSKNTAKNLPVGMKSCVFAFCFAVLFIFCTILCFIRGSYGFVGSLVISLLVLSLALRVSNVVV